MPSNWNEATGMVETLQERYFREAREFERYCATHGTGSKDGRHLDCPNCDAAEIIAAHEQRKAGESRTPGGISLANRRGNHE